MPFYSVNLTRLSNNTISPHSIILDLDETLVYTFKESERDDSGQPSEQEIVENLKILSSAEYYDLRKRVYKIQFEDAGGTYNLWGITRPHVYEFLIFCFSYFRFVGVWSAGKPDYVRNIVEFLFRDIRPPHIIYDYEECEKNRYGDIYKPIAKMIEQEPELDKYLDLRHVFIVDDKKKTFCDNPENGILIPSYEIAPTVTAMRTDDPTLQQLMLWFLQKDVIMSEDVRLLNKTNIFITPIRKYREMIDIGKVSFTEPLRRGLLLPRLNEIKI